MISNSFQNYTWMLNMPAYCFDFNVYKQANVNMVIRSWQHYRRFLGALSFLSHHDNVYPCAYPGNFRRFLRWGGGGPSPTDWKKALTLFFFFVFVSPQLILQRDLSDHFFFSKENYHLNVTFQYSMEKDGPTFPGDPTFLRGRGPIAYLYINLYNCDFQGAGVRTPAPSSGSARGIRLTGFVHTSSWPKDIA